MNRIQMMALAIVFLMTPTLAWAEGGTKEGYRQGKKEEMQEYRKQQKEENQAFRQTLKDMTPEERVAAIKVHRQEQYQENLTFSQKMYDEHLARLKEKLAGNAELTDAQKTEIISRFETKHQEKTAYRQQKHEENMVYFEKIVSDPNLTQEQKKEAMKTYWKAQKAEGKQHRETEKAKHKAFRDKMHSEVKSQNLT